jgi:hypothetical protein
MTEQAVMVSLSNHERWIHPSISSSEWQRMKQASISEIVDIPIIPFLNKI